ncbi:MAG TPA: hypothetical protein VFE25_13025 [Opitutaceae bacterium]|nr:hypothetical protein [Opitutaceae bacterium]
MTDELYLLIEKGGYYGYPTISKVLRKRPDLTHPTGQALIKIVIDIPHNILEVPEVKVAIGEHHLQRPIATVTPTQGAR